MDQKIDITDAAKNRLKELSANKLNNMHIMLTIHSGGCAGYRFEFSYLPIDKINFSEHILYKTTDFEMVIDNQSCSMIQGLELDYIEDNFGHKFVFNNAKNQCGCGKSFGI